MSIAYTVPLFLRGEVIADDLVSFGTRSGAEQFQAPDMSKHVDRLPLVAPGEMADLYSVGFDEILDVLEALGAALDFDTNTHLHVSFDVDFLDPDIAPGVGTTIPGGPTYREAQLCMEMIADTGRLASLDVMELNPALDVRNQTAVLAVDLIESLFGKSTLMRK